MSAPEKYTRHLLQPPDANATEALAWWFAPVIALLPAFVVGLLAGLGPGWAEQIRTLALVWGIGAALAAWALETWRRMTRRFAGFPLSTALAIAAIAGGPVAMIAGLNADGAFDFSIRFACGLGGALQGGVVVWLVAGPYEDPPETETEEPDVEDDPANPPTSAP